MDVAESSLHPAVRARYDEVTERLADFVSAVGAVDPVTVVGGGTHDDVGGDLTADARAVRAPAGVIAIEPAELTVRVGAGAVVADVNAQLAPFGQRILLPQGADGATVGGALMVGHSGIDRLGAGPIRDELLEAWLVGADGVLVRAGGPTVKNVSGFDLCRLLVGSLGTIGAVGEVLLRTRPLPERRMWLRGEPTDPHELLETVLRPASVLWDGSTTWVGLAGRAADVAADARSLAETGMAEAEGPPPLGAVRTSVAPAVVRSAGTGWSGFVAEIGVGVVHSYAPLGGLVRTPMSDGEAALHRLVKLRFDPAGRLNPGRSVLGVAR